MADKIEDFEVNSERWLSLEDFDGEVWKDIPGYESLYQVSNLGRVKSLPRGKQRPFRRTHNNIRIQHLKNGYLSINLSKNNEVKWLGVHRLVAMAFIPNPYDYPQVNHKDENKTNNYVCINLDGSVDFEKSNLEWCTQSYNNLWGTATKRQTSSRKRNDPAGDSWKKAIRTRDARRYENSAKPVVQYDINGNFVGKYKSLSETARMTGICLSDISRCCSGKRKQAKSFIIRYYGV